MIVKGTVVARRSGIRVVVTCPYCHRDHTHSGGGGVRVAHCWQGDYNIQVTL